MKKSLYLSIVLITSFFGLSNTSAQTPQASGLPEVVWSEPQKISGKESNPEFSAVDSQYVYLITRFPSYKANKKDEHRLDVFERSSMKRISSEQIELPELPDLRLQLMGLYVMNGQLLGKLSGYHEESSMIRSYLYKIKLGGETEPLIFLAETSFTLPTRRSPAMSIYPMQYISDPHSILFSPSKQYLLIAADQRSDEENKSFSFRVLDADLEVVWEKEVEFSDISSTRNNTTVRLDNQGHVHILVGRRYSKIRNVVYDDSDKPKYSLISYDPFTSNIRKLTLDYDKKQIGARFVITPNNDLIVVGLYAEDFDEDADRPKATLGQQLKGEAPKKGIKGIFYFRIDPETYSVVASSQQDFTPEFKEQFKQSPKDDLRTVLHSFGMSDMVVKADGGVTLVLEQNYQTSKSVRTYGEDKPGYIGTKPTRANIYYNFSNDLVVADMDRGGTLNWTVKVPKQQKTEGPDDKMYIGHALAREGNNLYFIFNDHPSNLVQGSSLTYTMKNPASSQVAIVRIDENGNQERRPLIENKGMAYALNLDVIKSNKLGEFFAYSRNRTTYKMLSLGFWDRSQKRRL